MEAFVVKIFPSLLIIALMTSSVVAESRENKNHGTSGHTFSAKNSTKDECNQDGIGIRSVVHYYFNNRNRQCYKQFFVGGKPPDGLRKLKDKDIQYICQPPRPNQLHQNPPDTYYATMFDKRYGIAVFSAYTLTKEKAVFKNYNGQLGWCPTPGIQRQGSDESYRSHTVPFKYHKGHLAPKFTLSSNRKHLDSTYSYTNAVPQCPNFNSGLWSTFEGKIRNYAKYICTKQNLGTLYLLTGTSFVHIKNDKTPLLYLPIKGFPLNNNPTIYIPNSLWTAGCCVGQGGNAESFAVIGNNVQNKKNLLTMRVTVAELQNVLAAGVKHHKIGGPQVDLFPGKVACKNNDSNKI